MTFLKKHSAKVLAAAAAVMVSAPAFAWNANAQYWLSVGILSRFNVATQTGFTAKNSDMECGFATAGNAALTNGYSIGKSKILGQNNKHLGLLIGGNLNWTNASGTIGGDVYISGTTNATITGSSPVTLLPGYSVYPLSGADLFKAVNQDLWAGWTNDTAPWGNGNSLLPNNWTPGAAGWSGHSEVTLDGTFSDFFTDYLTKMADIALFEGTNGAPANGSTTYASYYSNANGPRYNITLDARNLKRCDMPGNNAGNCSATGGANTQPGGRRAVHIFNVDAAKISNSDVINLVNAPAKDEFGSPVWTLVRVKDSGSHSVKFGSMGLQDFAPKNTRTLWVMDRSITKIELAGVGFEGTILAPQADVIANNGNINGSIIAKSFTGTLEGHCAPFENYIDP